MALLGNTSFWFFFFMIGFVATIEIIEDLGAQWLESHLHRQIKTVWLVISYIVAILLMIKMLRLFGTTYTWTANALRNGALLFSTTKICDRRAYRYFLVLVFLTFYPYWHLSLLVALGLAATLVILLLINQFQEWVVHSDFRAIVVLIAASIAFWLFDMWAYDYPLGETLLITLGFIVIMLLAHLYARMLVYRKRQTHELLYDTQHDSLTGAYSVGKFNNDFTRFRTLNAKGGAPAIHLIMMDIDHFKHVNDTYGHLVGNQVLKAFSTNCHDFLEKVEFPCSLYRTGGEEFSIIVNGASDKQVNQLAEDYRQWLKRLAVRTTAGMIHVTISAGITRMQAVDVQNDQVIGRADSNLYAAKRAGRDTVMMD
ncbi:Signal transduction diguanylate cyclase [Secundilactobacillus odoratitofui DSM 19909 = JCM 15043]|uniref:Signal transduction diguanylate cyclase n=1 Tax=Secundilactobacillus odoratitofui DSM 19909 = JCM 15043 TaxID=1423776 RepID=A0A0R1LNH6_9LACO|nr:GGDEF domain-containing protein [Secundilactobacillus odoratitofui]KRK97064.1 Signal transduction diguanylate cyclase [Secundilactobacillus odoratitofui DSM 19909 = JCM 15043]